MSPSNPIELRWLEHNTSGYWKVVDLRKTLLREPLGLDFTANQLAAEQNDLILAACSNEDYVGCLLLTITGSDSLQMRQVAVSPTFQNQGIGKLLVLESEHKAKSLGYSKIILHARQTAVGFYKKLGYAAVGEPFIEVTIPHRHMTKSI